MDKLLDFSIEGLGFVSKQGNTEIVPLDKEKNKDLISCFVKHTKSKTARIAKVSVFSVLPKDAKSQQAVL